MRTPRLVCSCGKFRFVTFTALGRAGVACQKCGATYCLVTKWEPFLGDFKLYPYADPSTTGVILPDVAGDTFLDRADHDYEKEGDR